MSLITSWYFPMNIVSRNFSCVHYLKSMILHHWSLQFKSNDYHRNTLVAINKEFYSIFSSFIDHSQWISRFSQQYQRRVLSICFQFISKSDFDILLLRPWTQAFEQLSFQNMQFVSKGDRTLHIAQKSRDKGIWMNATIFLILKLEKWQFKSIKSCSRVDFNGSAKWRLHWQYCCWPFRIWLIFSFLYDFYIQFVEC